MKRRILCLYLPEWPIQRALAAHRSKVESRRSKDVVLVLHQRDSRRGDVVAAASAAAQQAGVRPGMPLTEAASLISRVGPARKASAGPPLSHPTICPHDPEADLVALTRLAEHCERFSPIVGWQTVESSKFKVQGSKFGDLGPGTLDFGPATGPDSLFLDITGIGVLFGGEDHLARELLKDVRRLGYEARAAIADTIGAAWAAASQESSRFKVQGSRFFHGYEPTLNFELGTLNLAALRLPTETIDLLTQLGIQQVSELLALPRESLKARFGERLILRIDQLLGTAQETIVAHRPPPQLVEEWLLEYPAEGREIIERIVEELVRRLARSLAERREGVLRLVCRLDCAPGQPLFLQIGLFRPSADARHLWELVRMHLERAALTGALGRVRLEAMLTAKLENRQGLLFAGDDHQAAGQFAQLIDRVSSRLGPRAVLKPELTADPLPEKAVRYRVGFRVQGSDRKQFKVQSSRFKVSDRRRTTLNFELGTLNLCSRPLALYSPPIPINAVSIAPDGPPMSFEWAGHRHQIVHQSGPERIETGWWRGKSVRRDYWRVETATGERFWLFRHLESGRWNLHGAYT